MKKVEFMRKVAALSGSSSTQVERVMDAFFSEIGDYLSDAEKVSFSGFGTFHIEPPEGEKGKKRKGISFRAHPNLRKSLQKGK